MKGVGNLSTSLANKLSSKSASKIEGNFESTGAFIESAKFPGLDDEAELVDREIKTLNEREIFVSWLHKRRNGRQGVLGGGREERTCCKRVRLC